MSGIRPDLRLAVAIVAFAVTLRAGECDRVPPGGSGDCNSNGIRDRCDLAALLLKPVVEASHELGLGGEGFPGPFARTFAIADLNGDGRPDLTVGGLYDPHLAVLLSSGGNAFSRPVIYEGVRTQSALAAADLDGDGRIDLVVGIATSQEGPPKDALYVFKNTGEGRLASPREVFVDLKKVPHFVTTGDFDGDGDADLLTVNAQSSDLALLWNSGNGSFPEVPQRIKDPVRKPFMALAMDFDQDGDLDLAVTEDSPSACAVLNSDGKGSFSLAARIPLLGTRSVYEAIAPDLNQDGLPDLAFKSEYFAPDADIQASKNLGRLSFSAPERLGESVLAGSSYSGLVASDVNGDGSVDLAASTRAGELRFFSNVSPTGSADSSSLSFASLSKPGAMIPGGLGGLVAADFDGDGMDSIAATSFQGSPCRFFGSEIKLLRLEPATFSSDCNRNHAPDECDIASGHSFDCDRNGLPDECDGRPGSDNDCDQNGLPDTCEPERDCNSSGKPDVCDISSGSSLDTDADGTPDECQAQTFALVVNGPESLLGARPGAVVRGEYVCAILPGSRVRAGANHSDGAQGWSLSLRSDGVATADATSEGTASANRCAGTPGLLYGGFLHTDLTHGAGNEGVVSAVVLSAVEPITLPANRPSVVLKLTVVGITPEVGVSAAGLVFVDGLRGVGQPVQNHVTWRGATYQPTLRGQAIRLSNAVAPFRRGDANLDGRVDVSDSITILS